MYTEQYSAVYQIHMVMTRLYREHKTQDSVECNHVTARDISACMATRHSVFTLHNIFKITVYVCVTAWLWDPVLMCYLSNCCHYQVITCGDLHKFCRVLTEHQSCSKLLESV